jgi:mannosyltransferase OCH1-like enzyme
MKMESNRQPIPKIIHYCWFGKGKKTPIIQKCINSWKNHLSDYQIFEWNEENFDITSTQFVYEAYNMKKYAFVSDYVRMYALYHYGGIYLDTDTEVLKSLDPFLEHNSFWGFEEKNKIATSTIGAKKRNRLIKTILDSYEEKKFILEDGSYNIVTNVAIISELVGELGVQLNGKYQELIGLGSFYPQTYFSPYDYINFRFRITDETYTIHHFDQSWLPWNSKVKSRCNLLLSKVIGGENMARLRELVQGGK